MLGHLIMTNLDKVLERRQINLNRVANETGINASTLSKYRSTEVPVVPSLITVLRLCDYLNVSTEYVLGRDDDFHSSGPVVQALKAALESPDNADLARFIKSLFTWSDSPVTPPDDLLSLSAVEICDVLSQAQLNALNAYCATTS